MGLGGDWLGGSEVVLFCGARNRNKLGIQKEEPDIQGNTVSLGHVESDLREEREQLNIHICVLGEQDMGKTRFGVTLQEWARAWKDRSCHPLTAAFSWY